MLDRNNFSSIGNFNKVLFIQKTEIIIKKKKHLIKVYTKFSFEISVPIESDFLLDTCEKMPGKKVKKKKRTFTNGRNSETVLLEEVRYFKMSNNQKNDILY